jgi:hypothetical protein
LVLGSYIRFVSVFTSYLFPIVPRSMRMRTSDIANFRVARSPLGCSVSFGKVASVPQLGRRAEVQKGRRAEGQKGRRAEGQKGRRAEGQKGRRAEGQKGRRAEGQKGNKYRSAKV